MNDTEEIIQEVMEDEGYEEIRNEDTADDGSSGASEADTSNSESDESPVAETEALRAEIKALREELDKKVAEQERILSQLGEFSALFPDITLDSLPSEVWDQVSMGAPLAAAYALYEKKVSARRALAQAVNSQNAERSSGAVGRDGASEFYSPAEVRRMSAAEVRKNYNTIIESMKKWN